MKTRANDAKINKLKELIKNNDVGLKGIDDDAKEAYQNVDTTDQKEGDKNLTNHRDILCYYLFHNHDRFDLHNISTQYKKIRDENFYSNSIHGI